MMRFALLTPNFFFAFTLLLASHAGNPFGTAAELSKNDWARFRGPNGNGNSATKNLPSSWSADENIVWKTALPGLGASSPITVADRIYLACYNGYGEKQDAPGSKSDLVRQLVCLDRQSGDIIWKTSLGSLRDPQDYRGFVALHGYVSSSPVSDGERLFTMFGNSGVYAFDMEGKQLWHAEIGERTHGFGTAASPLLYADTVIVNASVESGHLIAFDKKTGDEVWRAPNIPDAWNTPVLVDNGKGGQELVIDTADKLRAFDPKTGEFLWHIAGSQPPRYICPSPVVHEGVIYAVHGLHGPTSAVRPGGRGDVTDSHREWVQSDVKSNVPSPVYYDGHLYAAKAEGGVAMCIDVKTGDTVYQERLRPSPGTIYGSATAADGKIYFVSRQNGVFVISAGEDFEQIAHNTIETDSSIFNASIVVSQGQLLLRSDTFLYCIGN